MMSKEMLKVVVKMKVFDNGFRGWREIKTFDSFAEADLWLMNYIKTNNYCGSDFTISLK